MSGVAVCPHDDRMCLPKETCWGSSPEQGLGKALFAVSTLWFFLSSPLQTVVGTDIAELLLRDHRTVWLPGKSPDEANLIDFTNEAVGHTDEEESGEAQLAFLTDTQATAVAGTLEKDTERFRELLLYGRKKVGPGPTGAARGSWAGLGRGEAGRAECCSLSASASVPLCMSCLAPCAVPGGGVGGVL